MINLKTRNSYGLIILFGLLFYVPFLGGIHLFDWDEINFAESAREMIKTGNYLDVQINFQPFWEKPPLFIWIQVLSMKLFGINEFAARFPNAICGILSLLFLFHLGKKLKDEKFAWLWVLSYTCSILPFFYFKSGIIDPWFNLFIFIGIVHFTFYFSEDKGKIKNLILSSFFIGLAILTKGPVALLILIICFLTFLIIKKFKIKTSVRDILLFSFVLTITGGFWFILQILHGNYHIVQDFISYQLRLFNTEDAGHGGFFLYHFAVLIGGVFPASVFAIPGFKTRTEDIKENSDFRLWMLILFWTVLILFTIVKTKIVHYSSLCYFPLTFLAAMILYKSLNNSIKIPVISKVLTLITGTILGLLVLIIPLVIKFKSIIMEKGWIKDPFTQGNLLADADWRGFELYIGLAFIILIWFFIYKSKIDKTQSIIGIFISSLIFTYLSILFITPRIEEYSQAAAIEFFQSVQDEDAYINTLGYKSYAHLYYGNMNPLKNHQAVNKEWLLEGKIDKPAYFVYKINRKERYMKQYPQLKILYEKNGFVFTKRSNPMKTVE